MAKRAAPAPPPCRLQDCPGQIELYSHLSVFKTFVDYLKRDGWQICVVRAGSSCVKGSLFTQLLPAALAEGGTSMAHFMLLPSLALHASKCTALRTCLPQIYCLDSQFTSEMPKFIAGTLQVGGGRCGPAGNFKMRLYLAFVHC